MTFSLCFKRVHQPVVEDLDLPCEPFAIPVDPSHSLLTYTAEPGSFGLSSVWRAG
jgi:hypothetical protein